MRRLTVQNFMTLAPVVIGSERTLAEAHVLMRARGIRHLPVVDGGRLVGIVSQRDLYLLQTLRGVDREAERVREAMTADPFTVPPDAPIDEVAARMADHKYGSAVVVDRGAVIGVFTTVDALRALAAIARRKRVRAPRTDGTGAGGGGVARD